jgi:hypothetical protein
MFLHHLLALPHLLPLLHLLALPLPLLPVDLLVDPPALPPVVELPVMEVFLTFFAATICDIYCKKLTTISD